MQTNVQAIEIKTPRPGCKRCKPMCRLLGSAHKTPRPKHKRRRRGCKRCRRRHKRRRRGCRLLRSANETPRHFTKRGDLSSSPKFFDLFSIHHRPRSHTSGLEGFLASLAKHSVEGHNTEVQNPSTEPEIQNTLAELDVTGTYTLSRNR